MNSAVTLLASALTFFSRFPVPGRLATVPIVEAAVAAPAAGVVVALPSAVLMTVLLAAGTSTLLAAVAGVLTLIVVTGALHEDGLADCADGFFGGASPERRVEIMRDSRIGTFGVLALIGAVLLKVAVLDAALQQSAWAGVLAFVAAAAAARAVALYPWVGLPAAREDGLAASVGQPSVRTFRGALVVGIIATAVLTAWWAPVGFIVAGIAAAAVVRGCAVLAERLVGGHTGDVIGASIILADLTYLAALTIWAL